MFYHCNTRFKHKDIWFLFDNNDFKDRQLYISVCPQCKKTIIQLYQTRKLDGRRFADKLITGQKADNFLIKHKLSVDYTYKQVQQKKCKVSMPRSLRYGQNIQLKNGNIKRVACDFYGNKEVIEIVEV